MAQTINPVATRNKHIFNSVFPRQSVAAQAKNKPTKTEPRIDLDGVQRQLREALMPLLGIGATDYVFGWDNNLDGEPFRIPLSTCARVESVRQYSDEEIQAHCAQMSQSEVWQKLASLRNELGTQQATRLVAELLHGLLKNFVRVTYSKVYRTDLTEHLRFWVENIFSLVVRMTDLTVTGANQSNYNEQTICRWTDSATTVLGALRVREMYGVIARQTNADGMIEDLKSFITGPATRSYLTGNFNDALADHALHPGVSTMEILRLYISIIKFFRKLDPKGVLLDRVARRVRRYLRERDDTVKVVVSGLLSDPNSATKDPETLTELAAELHQSSQPGDQFEDNELDWDNMYWMPDPADAAPDYMKSRSTDVIGSLISLFDSKEVFVKELQVVFADRLLENKSNFDLEVNVLGHLKSRLGESALQSCEVMLRDILDSVKIDEAVNKDSIDVEIHAKVLSRLFWPAMPEQNFLIPQDVWQAQLTYQRGYSQHKTSRTLSMIPSMGHLEVEIELEDRTIYETVQPHQASVIYSFESKDSSSVEKSVAQLATEIEMSPALARSACIFWVSKRVLAEIRPDTFTVIERLSDGGDVTMAEAGAKQEASAAAAEAAAALAAREAEEEERKAKMAMYHQFVVSMLTNQGAMPLPRIAMMLNIVVPGGFPFSNEELKDFLTGMVKEGQLQVGPGGNYKATG